MANRSLQQLEALALFDGRFSLNSIRDWGPQGNHAQWIAGREPTFKRDVGQVVGLDFTASGQAISVPAFDTGQEYAFEFLARWRRNAGYEVANSRIMSMGVGAREVLVTNAGQVEWTSGAWLLAPGAFPQSEPAHALATRDNADNGTIYVNGVPVATGAVGANVGASIMYIGNRAAFNRTFDGIIFSVRVIGTHIDADEASLLYEHSRIQLWPGAQKRSGIVSRV